MTKPVITALPVNPPLRSESATFEARSDPWLTALATAPAEVNALTDYIDDFKETPSAVKWWQSGDSYTQGVVVFDPASGGLYRAKTSHSSSTAPGADSTNWEPTGGITPASQAKLDLITADTAVDLDTIRTTKTYTANGSLTEKDLVVLETDGKVGSVVNSGSSFAIGSIEAAVAPATVVNNINGSIASLGGGKFIFIFETSSVVKYIVGTYSGGSWSWGTIATLVSFNTTLISCDYDIAAGHGAIILHDGSNNRYAYAFTVSGTVATAGAALLVGTASNGFPSVVVSNGYCVFVTPATNMACYACTISGTTLGSLGSALTLDSGNANGPIGIVDLGSDTFGVAWSELTTDDSNFAIISRSGTTLTLEDTVELDNWTTNPTTSVTLGLVDATTVVVTYENNSGDGNTNAILIPFSGTTIGTPGTPLSFGEAIDASGYKIKNCADGGNFYFGGKKFSNGYPYLFEISYEGTTMTLESTTILESNQIYEFSGLAFDTTLGIGVGAWRDTGNVLDVFQFDMEVVNTNVGDWVGFVNVDAADGETVSIAGPGDLVSGFSGLTVNSDVYVTNAGAITHDVTTNKIGIAVSATEILVTEGNT